MKTNVYSISIRFLSQALVIVLFSCVQLLAQTNISGTVTDDKKIPMPGATVTVKGTTTGVTTDVNGKYAISSDANAILSFSFIGYKVQEVAVAGRSVINVELDAQSQNLDDVVIVAYGSQSKHNVTGAVQTVNQKELKDIPASQLTQKLQGKLAGVQINQTTGIPGQGMSVRIRGQASISAGSEPLYVVDGFPITGNIANINPDEIETISVLKDASSTSLYGSRAANGVVIVTTKRAKAGTSTISVSAYTGIQQIPQKGRPDMMNATEFAQFKKEVAIENGQTVPDIFQNPEQYGEGTNWYDAVTRSASIQNYSVSFNSSKDKFSTSVVAGYFKQNGVLLNSDYSRYSLRINTDYKFNDKVKVGFNAAPTFSSNHTPQSDGIWYNSPSIVQSSLLTSPLAPYKNADGSIPLNTNGYGTADGPNWYNQVQVVKNKARNSGLLANGFIEIEPINGLTYKSSINIDLGNSVSDYFYPSTAGNVFNAPNESDVSRINASHGNSLGYSWLWENTLSYQKSIGEHQFDILGGYTSQTAHSETGSFSATGFPDNKVQTFNAAKTITGGTDIQDWTLLSYVGRVNYNFKQKYILSAAIRRDGSSKFGVDKRWGNFPSVSAGWIISDEAFMSNIKAVSFLKLRASYGVIGNNNVGNYTQYASVVATNNPVGNQYVSGKSIAGLNNTALGWENTKELDLGVDINFLNNRINFGYDYYHKTTDALLYTVDIPISSGFFNFATNIGKLAFWGHEFTLSSQNLRGNLTWNTDFNISFNKNKALALGTANAAIFGDNTITEVGKPLGQLYALEWLGVYKDQADFDSSPRYAGAEVGTVKFKDVNGDGIVTNDDRDKTVVGNSAPKAIFGITNSFTYKNFDLSIVGAGAFGNKIINVSERFTTNLDGTFNVLKGVSQRWRSEEDPGAGIYGKSKANTTGYERDWSSSKFIYNANYFTIKNITLGYQVGLKENKYIHGLRVYTSIQHAFVFTKYPGGNPEVSAAGGLFSGSDYTTYPVPRTFTLGINFNL
ncbi:TonB-dependent receptor [Dyadobacter sp. CY312]|uniref:SusC/RagA family TonB-linked outer membrane protein n=1 Tax=Dyadobacter sp. CY312 TaxID=2907303 RepID=UPI001F26A768|nr:TonB-dependent receptor [Dyadobacter sp. CY312]MCE7043778.1 TonB-dependent receptor [Dyadobacter sp. CY312]